MSVLVIGTARLPACLIDIPYAQQEAEKVAESLQVKALIGTQVPRKLSWSIVRLATRRC